MSPHNKDVTDALARLVHHESTQQRCHRCSCKAGSPWVHTTKMSQMLLQGWFTMSPHNKDVTDALARLVHHGSTQQRCHRCSCKAGSPWVHTTKMSQMLLQGWFTMSPHNKDVTDAFARLVHHESTQQRCHRCSCKAGSPWVHTTKMSQMLLQGWFTMGPHNKDVTDAFARLVHHGSTQQRCHRCFCKAGSPWVHTTKMSQMLLQGWFTIGPHNKDVTDALARLVHHESTQQRCHRCSCKAGSPWVHTTKMSQMLLQGWFTMGPHNKDVTDALARLVHHGTTQQRCHRCSCKPVHHESTQQRCHRCSCKAGSP